jgi:hypothetical protein
MKREEREERVKKIENQLFMMNMIDRWTASDRKRIRELEEELKGLKKEA